MASAGETDLQKILRNMEPVLVDGVFVFVTLPGAKLVDPEVLDLEPVGAFFEREGLSLIVPVERARGKGYPCDEQMRLISLTVHSALSMFGLTAAISAKLAANSISCNVVAAYHHDHLFVDATRAEDAMQALKDLSASVDLTLHVSFMSGGDVADVSMCISDTVLQLKLAVEEASGIPAVQQRLFAGGSELLNPAQLGDTPVASSPDVLLINQGSTTYSVATYSGPGSVATYSGSSVAEAANQGALGDVVRLVEAGADINSKFDTGYAALHHMAAVPGAAGGAYGYMKPEAASVMMRWLIQMGADVNQGDDGGKTPLHVLGKYGGHRDQLHALLDGGADVNKPMNYGEGWTPLWYVRNYKIPVWRDFEAVLLERGARQHPDALE